MERGLDVFLVMGKSGVGEAYFRESGEKGTDVRS